MSPDKNVESVRAKLLERSHAGLAKYGVTTERTDTDLVGWLNHLQEELMDAAVYVQRSMVEIEAQKAELEAARKDAERYRWLRSFRPGLWLDGITLEPIENKGYALQLDSAIDSTIEQAKGGV